MPFEVKESDLAQLYHTEFVPLDTNHLAMLRCVITCHILLVLGEPERCKRNQAELHPTSQIFSVKASLSPRQRESSAIRNSAKLQLVHANYTELGMDQRLSTIAMRDTEFPMGTPHKGKYSTCVPPDSPD